MKLVYTTVFFLTLAALSSVFANENFSNLTNSTLLEVPTPPSLELLKFFPKEMKTGEVQFNLQVQNNRDDVLNNVYAFISGLGISTYKITPIKDLGAHEKDYIFVQGQARESGTIHLTIDIEGYIFYQDIKVFNIAEESNTTADELKLKQLANLSAELENLKTNYTALELSISEKKDVGYDMTGVNLEDLKRYLRNVETHLLSKDLKQAEVTFQLALEEYKFQRDKVTRARIIPFITRLKENALVFSAIFGAILTFFALSELLKNKSQHAYENVVHLVRRPKKNYKKENERTKIL